MNNNANDNGVTDVIAAYLQQHPEPLDGDTLGQLQALVHEHERRTAQQRREQQQALAAPGAAVLAPETNASEQANAALRQQRADAELADAERALRVFYEELRSAPRFAAYRAMRARHRAMWSVAMAELEARSRAHGWSAVRHRMEMRALAEAFSARADAEEAALIPEAEAMVRRVAELRQVAHSRRPRD